MPERIADERGNQAYVDANHQLLVTTSGGQSADSLSAGANSTAPGAGTTIAQISAPPAGVYEIRTSVSVGAGAVAADNGNLRLSYNGSVQISALPTNGAEVVVPRVALNGTNVVAVSTIGAATAAVVYTVRITVTRVG